MNGTVILKGEIPEMKFHGATREQVDKLKVDAKHDGVTVTRLGNIGFNIHKALYIELNKGGEQMSEKTMLDVLAENMEKLKEHEKMELQITISFDNKTIVLNEREAKELKDKLNSIFGKQTPMFAEGVR